jgi:exonuclease III
VIGCHYIILRGRWRDIIVLNVHAPTEDKVYNIKDRFYEELEHVFDKFPKHNTKILLGNFNAKVGRGDIFKPLIGNEGLHDISNDNGVRVVHFATSENLRVKSTMSPHRNINKFTWMDLREIGWDGMDWIIWLRIGTSGGLL